MSAQRTNPFPQPVYVTRPLLPPLDVYTNHLEDIWNDKILTNSGSKHVALENAVAKYLRAENVSLFNNGTLALIIGLQCLELKGEVITTPFTFPGTVHAISWNGLTPVFCDVDPVTMNIDPKKIEQLITPRTSAILAVHVYGIPCAVREIEAIARKHNLKVIYDAAHAFGSEIDGIPIGAFGDMTMFSFHATKLFHTAEGGCLVYPDPARKTKIELLKNFGILNQEQVSNIGINGKMNELQAALGVVVLEHLEEERRKRQKVADTYFNILSKISGIQLMPTGMLTKESLQYFVIRIDSEKFGKSRDQVFEELKHYNVFSRKYFYPLCSSYPCYKELPSSEPRLLPVANKLVHEVLCLPFFGDLYDGGAEKIANLLLEIQNTPLKNLKSSAHL